MKILLIEDEKLIGETIQEVLSLEGYDVTQVFSGIEGIHYAQNYSPDLILCDIMMPELDGYDVLHHIRSTPQTASIPFVFVTAVVDRISVEKSKVMGADGYVSKPFTFPQLFAAINDAVS